MKGNNTLTKTILLGAALILIGVGCAPQAEAPPAEPPAEPPAPVSAPEEMQPEGMQEEKLDPSESEPEPAPSPPPEPEPQPQPEPKPSQPSCTEDVWSCGDWSACSAGGMQTRNCEMTFDCPGIVTRGPMESRACEPPCTEDTWQCGDWSECSQAGEQTRTCTLTDDCPHAQTPGPETTRSCEPPPQEPEPVAFTFEGDDDAFYPSGPLDVSAGAQVTLTFVVRSQNVYYGGLEFRAPGRFDTGPLGPGESATVSFTADQDFVITSYWPSSNAKKADLLVRVTP